MMYDEIGRVCTNLAKCSILNKVFFLPDILNIFSPFINNYCFASFLFHWIVVLWNMTIFIHYYFNFKLNNILQIKLPISRMIVWKWQLIVESNGEWIKWWFIICTLRLIGKISMRCIRAECVWLSAFFFLQFL